MDGRTKEKINQLLESEAINYLETSERLIVKNALEKETHSELELQNIAKIIIKYGKFIKN